MIDRVRVEPFVVGVADAVALEAGGAYVDPDLRAAGQAHVAAVSAGRDVFDGRVLCWSGPRPGGGIRVAAGGYLDMLATCDALRAEGVDGPLRRRAVAVAGGDPFTSGHGRAAAVGVTVLATRPGPDGEPVLTLGRRGDSVATDAGCWHVAPSGMLEADPTGGGAHLAHTVATELAEELGIVLDVTAVTARGRVLGLVHDVARLRPDLVVRLDLDPSESGSTPAMPAGEFDAFVDVPATPDAVAAFLAARRPEEVTAPATGALRLLVAGG